MTLSDIDTSPAIVGWTMSAAEIKNVVVMLPIVDADEPHFNGRVHAVDDGANHRVPDTHGDENHHRTEDVLSWKQ